MTTHQIISLSEKAKQPLKKKKTVYESQSLNEFIHDTQFMITSGE